jgi:putative transposase
MSRLRRPFLTERFFFLTVKLLPKLRHLSERDFAVLARSLDTVRSRQRFVLTTWVFLPDHWHAILLPPCPLSISAVMKSVKLSSTNALGSRRRESGELWQGRFFDRALRTVQEYWETVEHIHLNPVRRGLVERAEGWRWSSAAEYSGVSADSNGRVAVL